MDLPGPGGHHVFTLETAGSYLFAGADSGLYRRPLAALDTLWMPMSLDSVEVRSVLVFDTSTLLASAAWDSSGIPVLRVYRSTDQGTTWSPAALPPANAYGPARLAANPADPDTVYLGISHVLRSSDGGATWNARESDTGPSGFQGEDVELIQDNGMTAALVAGTGVYRGTGPPGWRWETPRDRRVFTSCRPGSATVPWSSGTRSGMPPNRSKRWSSTPRAAGCGRSATRGGVRESTRSPGAGRTTGVARCRAGSTSSACGRLHPCVPEVALCAPIGIQFECNSTRFPIGRS